MRRITSAIVLLLWGAWFGGLFQLFLSVVRLFDKFPRPQAGEVAADMFHEYEKHRLILSGAMLLAMLLWYIVDKSKMKLAVFALVAIATCAASISATTLIPQLETLRERGLQQTNAFKHLHGQAMMVYVSEECLLLIAGLLLPAAISGRKPAPVSPTP